MLTSTIINSISPTLTGLHRQWRPLLVICIGLERFARVLSHLRSSHGRSGTLAPGTPLIQLSCWRTRRYSCGLAGRGRAGAWPLSSRPGAAAPPRLRRFRLRSARPSANLITSLVSETISARRLRLRFGGAILETRPVTWSPTRTLTFAVDQLV